MLLSSFSKRRSVIGLGLASTVVALGTTGCNVGKATFGQRIPADQFGILINLYGQGEKGIANGELVTDGRVPFNSINESLELFPKTVVTYRYSDDEGVESEVPEAAAFSLLGTLIKEDVRLGVRIPFDDGGEAAKTFLQTHGLDSTLRTVMQTFVKAELEDCFAKTVSTLNITSIEEYNLVRSTDVSQGVQSCLNTEFGEYLEISNFSLIGVADLPPEIQQRIDAAQAAKQRSETAKREEETAKSEAAANLARTQGQIAEERARAELAADPNYITQQNLELQRLRLEIEKTRAENWNGVEPNTIVVQSPNAQVSPTGAQ
jgi:hypothetical protein